MKAIIEHLEPEVYPWCLLEYKHISQIVGKENLIFTNVPKKDHSKLLGFGACEEKPFSELEFSNVCLLDPKADELLKPADKKFDYYLFGGILGNYPPEGRTKKAFGKFKGEQRHIGDKQMSTDTAVNVTHKIVDLGIPFDKLEFVDEPEIVLEEGYSNILPYRYLSEKGKPVLPEGLFDYLLNEE